MAEESELRQRSVQPTGPEPVLSRDREEEGGRNESTFFSKLFATMLVLPGIILYVYILYIVLANLLYPSSFAPFLPHRSSQKEENTTSTALGKYPYLVPVCVIAGGHFMENVKGHVHGLLHTHIYHNLAH